MAELDTILDNQEVTAEILNDIAIDLGATSFNGFGENKFGADELNGITGALVSSGILSSGEKCAPYISGNKVYIRTGIMVFSNGAKKKITENVELDLIPNSFIYALNDTVLNTCKIIVSETRPIDGDFVNLAEISSNNTLIDKRTIAKAKVELPSEGNSYIYKETISKENYQNYQNKTLTLPIDGASKIFIYVDSPYRYATACVYEYDISTQTFTGFTCNSVSGSSFGVTGNIEEQKVAIICHDNYYLRLEIEVLEQTDQNIVFSYILHKDSNWYSKDDGIFVINYCVFGGVER